MLRRRIIFLGIFLLLLTAAGVAARHVPNWAWIVEHEQWLRAQVTAHPWTSWLIGVGVYAGLSLVPGTSGKSIVCGWLFGFGAAVLMVELGLTAAAVIAFLIGRYLLHELVEHRWRLRLQIISRRFERDGAFYLLLLRFAHAPFTLVNYGAGATQIPLRTFWWTTHVGILPGAMAFTYAGTRLPTLRSVSEQGMWALVDLPLALALAATFLFPFAIRPLLRKVVRSRSPAPAAVPTTNSDSAEEIH